MNRSTSAAVVVALMLGAGIVGPTTPAAIGQAAGEIARYRSEFLGKLREALAGQRDVQIVGDRFVIQSGVLFRSGAAVLQPGGERLLAIVARQLIGFAGRLPKNANWVLQVDGHTDSTPINNTLYPSNWELSAARAIAVVKFLHGAGVANDRLVAAGYSQYQPLSTIDHARNRRIELKFIER
jgi:chemotaxis protein MotB